MIIKTADKKLQSYDDAFLQKKQKEALQIIDRTQHSIYKFTRDKDTYNKYKNEYLLIWGHRLFDVRFYLSQYPEVKISGEDPLLHYISSGWKTGYNPSPFFDNDAYIDTFLRDTDNKICPLVHYYSIGRFLKYRPIKIKQYEYKGSLVDTPDFNYDKDAEIELSWMSKN